MREAIQRYVLEHWEAFSIAGRPRPARLETLQLSNSAGQTYQHGGVIHLLFVPGEQAPVLCAKLRWDPAAREALEREHRALQAIAPILGDAAPRSYGIHQVAGRAVLLQEAATGPAMATALGRAYHTPGDCLTPVDTLVREHAERAAAVLERLWRAPAEAVAGAGLPRLDIAGIVQRYVREIEPDERGRTQAERLGAAAQRLVGHLPPRLVHGDVQPYNFFLSGGRTCLIDWEYAAAGDAWFVDPCRYVYYALHVLLDLGALAAPDVTAAFSETFLERRTWFAPIAADMLLRCLRPAVQDYRAAIPLLAVSLMYGCLLRRDCEPAADWGFTEHFRAQVQRCAEAYRANDAPMALARPPTAARAASPLLLTHADGLQRPPARDTGPSGRRTENTMDVLALPFDQYQRYRLVQETIEAVRWKTPLTVLDVGGSPGTLVHFLPHDRVIIADVADQGGLHLYANGLALPFPDGAFDIVTSCDTLEHIEPSNRPRFLAELVRVAREAVILGAPFNDPQVVQAEEILQSIIQAEYGERYHFLEEHRRYGLPDLTETQLFFHEHHFRIVTLPNGYLHRWLLAMSLLFLLQWRFQDQGINSRVNAYYNANFYRADNREPSYRKIIVATRTRDIVDLRSKLCPDHPIVEQHDALIHLQMLGILTNALATGWSSRVFAVQSDITFLQQELAGRDRTIAELQQGVVFLRGEVTQREQTIAALQEGIAFLRQELAQRDQALAALRAQLTHTERAVRELSDEVARREETVAQRDQALAALRAQREALEEKIRTLQDMLEVKALQIAHLEAQVGQQAEGIAWLRQEVALRDAQLAAIQRTRLWRAVTACGRIQQWLASSVGAVRSEYFRGGPKLFAIRLGMRIVPAPLKRLIKRFWDPFDALSSAELAILAGQPVAAATLSPAQMEAPRPAEDGAAPQTTPRPAQYDVLCFSIIDWDFRWQRPQQLMSQFANHGHRVFFLSTSRFIPETDNETDARYALRRLRDNVWEVQLAVPHPIDVYSGELPAELCEAVVTDLAALRAEFNISWAVSIVQVGTWAPAAYRLREAFGWRIVYDCMDEWTTFPGMKQALVAEERRLVERADLLVVSAQRLWDKWSPCNPNTILARNGADFEHFQNIPPEPLLEDAPRPIVGYFGAIAEWFDLDLMERLARERPQYTFVLLGGVFGVDVSPLERLPNVRVLGQQPYSLMPAYLQRFDACIIPFKVNPVTEATDPVKFYEYISQGKPVVATRMPELFPYHQYLYIADNHDDFLHKVDLALQENDPYLRAQRLELARQNTWQARLSVIKAGIQRVHPGASIVIVTYNNLAYTRLCLDSIFRNTLYPNYEVIVVDNGSTDGTTDYLTACAAERENVRVILNEQNAGFARATNQGLAAARGQYLILLNNDTVVPNGWLPRLLRHLDRPDIGLVVGVTNFAGNEARIEVPYTDLDGMEEFAAQYTRQHEGRIFDIRVAAMYCVGMRREVFERVGPLDERFTVGMFEDDDYSHRVRLAGLRVVCAEDVFVHHFGQASFKKLSPSAYQAIWEHNQRLYEQKWGIKWEPHRRRAG